MPLFVICNEQPDSFIERTNGSSTHSSMVLTFDRTMIMSTIIYDNNDNARKMHGEEALTTEKPCTGLCILRKQGKAPPDPALDKVR